MSKISKSERTYGGEVEVLSVNLRTRRLAKVPKETLEKIQLGLTSKGISGNSARMGYDSSYHLLETNLSVYHDLVTLVRSAQEATSQLNKGLNNFDIGLLSISHHPTDNIQQAYQNGVLSKPIYDLLSGERAPHFSLRPDILPRVYPTRPEIGRGWNHPIGTMSASIQPWNSLDCECASEQIAVLQATGFMFNLLTANSPFVERQATGLRDSRLRMWGEGGMIDTSRYPSERLLSRNLPDNPRGYADYFNFVLKNQRPFVLPLVEKQNPGSSGTEYKTRFMAVIQPPDEQNFSTLDLLLADSIPCVDIGTGEVVSVKPALSQIFNGFDFLYFPGNGARFRCNLPMAEQVDPKAFALAVENKDESSVQRMLLEAGIDRGGFVCAEGRVAATVLPTADNPTWDRFNLPFVLQTALIRAHEPVMNLLMSSGLSWEDLTTTLPKLTNQCEHGFNAEIKGVSATELALRVWRIAKKYLTSEEMGLIGDQIDKMLSTKTAPAEEQLRYVRNRFDLGESHQATISNLIEKQLMIRI